MNILKIIAVVGIGKVLYDVTTSPSIGKYSNSKRGIIYEKRQATKMKAKHKGGPGKHDYTRNNGKIKGEVKNWKNPVHAGIIRKECAKGTNEIISKSGFTKPAEKLAKECGIQLRKGK